VQTLASLEAFEPARYATELAAELPAAASLVQLEVRDAALAAALMRIDELAARVMRIRLEHALADETSIGAPTRRVFAQTVTAYVDHLDLLASRARDVAARGGADDPAGVAALVTEAARATLLLREAVRAPVLVLIREVAAASVAESDRNARNRDLHEKERKRWSAARRDLEAVAADPLRITSAAMPARMAALPEQIDEPEAVPEPSFAELLELD